MRFGHRIVRESGKMYRNLRGLFESEMPKSGKRWKGR